MKLTGTYNGKQIELELTEEQVEVLKKEEKKTGWERVKNNESYCVNFANGCGLSTERFDDIDANRYEKANCFSDETLAKNIIRAQALQRKLWRRSAELCEKVDWRNPETKKYYIIYDYEDDDLCVDFCIFGRGLEEIYFDTEEHAEQAIKEFKDELLWYFTKFESRMD